LARRRIFFGRFGEKANESGYFQPRSR